MRLDSEGQFRLALADLWEGARKVNLWSMLGWQDIRQRYRRSMLGPFWLTISTGVTILVLGLVYAAVFRVPAEDYLRFLAFGLVVWSLLSGLLNDGCQTFIASESIIKQIRLPFFVYALRVVWRNFIVFGHNLAIVVMVLLYFGRWPNAANLVEFCFGLALVFLNGVWVCLLFGIVCARFRDIPQIIANMVQLVFFVTPILWQPSLLPGRHRLIDYNPMFHFVELLRAPLLGENVSAQNWLAVVIVTSVGWAAALACFYRYRRRIPYWL